MINAKEILNKATRNESSDLEFSEDVELVPVTVTLHIPKGFTETQLEGVWPCMDAKIEIDDEFTKVFSDHTCNELMKIIRNAAIRNDYCNHEGEDSSFLGEVVQATRWEMDNGVAGINNIPEEDLQS